MVAVAIFGMQPAIVAAFATLYSVADFASAVAEFLVDVCIVGGVVFEVNVHGVLSLGVDNVNIAYLPDKSKSIRQIFQIFIFRLSLDKKDNPC